MSYGGVFADVDLPLGGNTPWKNGLQMSPGRSAKPGELMPTVLTRPGGEHIFDLYGSRNRRHVRLILGNLIVVRIGFHRV